MIANFKQAEDVPMFIEMTKKEYSLNKAEGIIKDNLIKFGSDILPVVISTRSVHPTYKNVKTR
mgnify:CR=1 FL=1